MSPRRSEELFNKTKWLGNDFKRVFGNGKNIIKSYAISTDYKYSPKNSYNFRDTDKSKWVINKEKPIRESKETKESKESR